MVWATDIEEGVMPSEQPIGIDLGAGFSAAARMDESGRLQLVPNTAGEAFTPSLVCLGKQGVVVGKEARFAAISHPHVVIEGVKRDLGRPFCSRSLHGRKFPPEVIQACILRQLREDIVRELRAASRVVIAVPASFGDLQRRATLAAAEIAGLPVLGLINEPAAAALNFYDQLLLSGWIADAPQEMTVLFFCLGNAFFDVALFRFSPNEIRTLAVDGDAQLGGRDWDMRIVNHLAHRFLRLYHRDLRRDRMVFNRVMAAVVNAKHALSTHERMTVRIEFFGRILEVLLTRPRLESLTADLLERMTNAVRRVLSAAGLEWKDISRVMLIGGASRMPMIAAALRRLGNLEPDFSLNGDEVVAFGAARFAAYLLQKESGGRPGAELNFIDVTSRTLGARLFNPATAEIENITLISRNTPLPAGHVQRFLTSEDNQREIGVVVFEGAADLPDQCSAIGRVVVRELPEGLLKDSPVDIIFTYGMDGLLSVEAVLPEREHPLRTMIEPVHALSPVQIDRWRQVVAGGGGFSTFEAALKDAAQLSPAIPFPTAPSKASVVRETISEGQALPSPAVPGSPNEQSISPEAEAASLAMADSPPAASPELTSQTDTAPAESQEAKTASLPEPRWRWVVRLVGHVIAGAMGLLLGYLILHRLRPSSFPFPPW